MCLGRKSKPNSGASSSVDNSLLDVRRVFVGQLSGGAQAAALRDLIIASLNSTRLFILTDNEARADAVLKGAADDSTYTDTFDTYEGTSGARFARKNGKRANDEAWKHHGWQRPERERIAPQPRTQARGLRDRQALQ